MGGFFGTVSMKDCVTDLFYGTDYNSHLGTKRGGMARTKDSSVPSTAWKALTSGASLKMNCQSSAGMRV